MSNQRNLKAFVRYDGSGRVVAGSLVLRKKKPKVGRWEEILTYECCNPTTSTTTTVDPRPRISQTLCGPLLPYREITIVGGTDICDGMIYLTGDFSGISNPFYVNVGNVTREFNSMGNQAYANGGCTSCGGGTTTTTTTQTQVYSNQVFWSDVSKADACSGSSITVYSNVPNLGNNVNIYLDQALTQTVNYNYISQFGGAWNCMSGFLYGQESCPPPTTSTTTTNMYYYDVELYLTCGSNPVTTMGVSSSVPAVIGKWYTKTDENIPIRVIATAFPGGPDYTSFFQQTPRDICDL